MFIDFSNLMIKEKNITRIRSPFDLPRIIEVYHVEGPAVTCTTITYESEELRDKEFNKLKAQLNYKPKAAMKAAREGELMTTVSNAAGLMDGLND